MKKLMLFAFIAIFAASCSVDDDKNLESNNVLIPVESINIPDTLVFEEVYDFEITYQRPSTCHAFAGFSVDRNNNERIIGLVNTVYLNAANCEDLENEMQTVDLPFEVLREDFYIFRFWQGTDENGEDVYLTKEVPVRIE